MTGVITTGVAFFIAGIVVVGWVIAMAVQFLADNALENQGN